MKKAYLLISVIAFIACLKGISYLIEGISQRGWTGVNYGRLIFPLLIVGISLQRFRKKQ